MGISRNFDEVKFHSLNEAILYEKNLTEEIYKDCCDQRVDADTEVYVTSRAEYRAGIRIIRIPNGTNTKGKPRYLWLVHRQIHGEIRFPLECPIDNESGRRMRALLNGYGHHVLTAKSSKDAHAAAKEIMAQEMAEAEERNKKLVEKITSGDYDTSEFTEVEVIGAILQSNLLEEENCT